MALSLREVLSVGDEFGKYNVRQCNIDNVKHFSVLDVISAMTGGEAKMT